MTAYAMARYTLIRVRRCARCGADSMPGQGYCRKHHAENMREWRKEHPHRLLPEPARRRANARAYANVYLRRGKLQRGPCEACGAPGAQMHHDDYDRPLDVRWFCRACHAEFHRLNSRRGTKTTS